MKLSFSFGFKVFLLLEALFFTKSDALAVREIPDPRASTVNFLSKAHEAGLSHIYDCSKGKVRLDVLITAAQSVDFLIAESFSIGENSTRWTAFNTGKAGRIFFNRNATIDPTLIGAIGLHEVIGTIGLSDNDYQITALVFFFREISENPYLDDSVKIPLLDAVRLKLQDSERCASSSNSVKSRIDHSNSNIAYRGGEGGGGGSIVGSGGDDLALGLKISLMYSLLRIGKFEKEPELRKFFKLSELKVELFGDEFFPFESGKKDLGQVTRFYPEVIMFPRALYVRGLGTPEGQAELARVLKFISAIRP